MTDTENRNYLNTQEKKLKIGILYDRKGVEPWDISYFKKEFEKKNIDVVLFDANKINDNYSLIKNPEEVSIPEIEKLVNDGYNIWMNRIYPSEASESVINKGLNVVSWLSKENCNTINPLTACAADYDKFFAFECMKQFGVPTPRTEKITSERGAKYYVAEFSFPLIVKRNTGGKGIGVQKIDNLKKLEEVLNDKEILYGKYLIQEFIKPSRNHDIRVGVIDGKPLISYGRTLVSKNGDGKSWMGSCNHGSKIIPYDALEEERNLAVLASKAIGANLNEVDIQITKNGPVVIENNPTPGYDEGEENWVELIVDYISRNYLNNEKNI